MIISIVINHNEKFVFERVTDCKTAKYEMIYSFIGLPLSLLTIPIYPTSQQKGLVFKPVYRCLSVCPFSRLFVSLCILSVLLSVPFVSPPFLHYVCLFVCLNVCPYVSSFFFLFSFVSVFLFLWLSVDLPTRSSKNLEMIWNISEFHIMSSIYCAVIFR